MSRGLAHPRHSGGGKTSQINEPITTQPSLMHVVLQGGIGARVCRCSSSTPIHGDFIRCMEMSTTGSRIAGMKAIEMHRPMDRRGRAEIVLVVFRAAEVGPALHR